MRDLNDIQSFAAVVSHNGFAPAGRALGVSKSSLSRHVSRLEERLGARLLERSTRQLRLTDAGASFYQHCETMLAELAAAEDSIALLRSEPSGTVRVSSPTGFVPVLARIMPDFMKAHPQVRVQIVVTNRRVDLIEESIDVALRARARLDDSSLTMRKLGQSAGRLVASPEFVAAHSSISDPEALKALPFLSMDEAEGIQQMKLHHASAESRVLALEPTLRSSDHFLVREVAIAGLGFALLPDQTVAAPLRDGRLVTLLPDWSADEATIHIVFTSRRGLLPAARALIDHLAEHLLTAQQELFAL